MGFDGYCAARSQGRVLWQPGDSQSVGRRPRAPRKQVTCASSKLVCALQPLPAGLSICRPLSTRHPVPPASRHESVRVICRPPSIPTTAHATPCATAAPSTLTSSANTVSGSFAPLAGRVFREPAGDLCLGAHLGLGRCARATFGYRRRGWFRADRVRGPDRGGLICAPKGVGRDWAHDALAARRYDAYNACNAYIRAAARMEPEYGCS